MNFLSILVLHQATQRAFTLHHIRAWYSI